MSGTTIANVKGGNIASTNGLTDRVKTASSGSALNTLVLLNSKLGNNSSNGTLKIVNTTSTSQDLKFVRKERWFFSTSLSQDRKEKIREAVVALFDKASEGMANKQMFMANVQSVLQKNEGIKNISRLMEDLTSRPGQIEGTGDAKAPMQSVELSSRRATVQDVMEQPLNADARQHSDALHHEQGGENSLLEVMANIEASSPNNSRSSRLRSTAKNGPHVSLFLDGEGVRESGLQNVRSTIQRQVSDSAESLSQSNQVEESFLDDMNWGVAVDDDFMDPNSVGRDSTTLMVNNLDAKQMVRVIGLKKSYRCDAGLAA